jgi:hypothetical protein
MAIEIRDGFLVNTFPRSNRTQRRARLVERQPDGVLQHEPCIQADGRIYAVAYLFRPGIMQGHAVAWPKGDA